ncbi:hypothetical protein Pcinc_021565 [Petrolisthes cinctipes]|uniref:Uncharacterized protein n=1 Tax=Petrolisthes cinctipes TaxID=88211 RepID=A0AAE1FFG4_PETCI|nr:hypothetical protein Pcinc_021565 [Petrolisthes cinctipes]
MTKWTTLMKRTTKRITRRRLLREENDHNQSTGTKVYLLSRVCVCVDGRGTDLRVKAEKSQTWGKERRAKRSNEPTVQINEEEAC